MDFSLRGDEFSGHFEPGSSTISRSSYTFFCSNHISRIEFTKQPPGNLRKSNFFHFMIQLSDQNGAAVEIERTSFIAFIQDRDVSFTFELWL